MDEENDENIPPQGRRSERVKGRKGASNNNFDNENVPIDDEDPEEVEDEEPEEEGNDEDGEDDEEDEQPRKRVKKTPPAKPRRRSAAGKANGVSKARRTSKTPRKSDAAEVVESTSECPILEALLDEKIALDPTVMEWIERYEEDDTAAMTEMVNFILRCCGCTFEIRQEDVNDEDNIIDNLAEIQEAYKQTNPREYPLIAHKKTKFSKFPKRLNEFFRRLLQKLSAKGMLDAEPSVLDKIQQWVFSLSSTNFRPFRHTATVISLGFITTLCDIYAKAKKAYDNSTVLLEKEKKSKKSSRTKELERILADHQKQLKTLTELMESTYDSVFVHRFRDVDHRIRTECVHELGLWMQRLPEVYFDAAHLRYMGWALSDSNATTRLDVVKSLQKLYESEEYVTNLRHFTERFQTRFIEMATSDADRAVRVATIGLLHNILKRDLLEPEDIDKISLMIFDPESRIRRAVVNIFLSNVDAMYEEMCESIGGGVEDVETELGNEKDTADGIPSTWLKYNALVKVLAKYDQLVEETEQEEKGDEPKLPYKSFELGEVESRISQAASAIITEMDELDDWDNLATYLLRDHSLRPNERGKNANNILAKARKACALNPSEEVMLLEVLNTAIRIRRDYEDEQESMKGKKRKRGASEAPEDENEIDVSTGLVRKLPQLIHRFGSKPETAAQILKMVQCVKLDKYSELRQLEALESLLEDVGKQFMNHTDAEVFKEASASLLHAQTFEHLSHVTEPKVIELQDEVNTGFLSTVNGKDLPVADLSSDELNDLTIAVARLENLLSVTDCTVAVEDETTKQGKSSFSLLIALLERAASVHDSDEIEMISYALKAIRWYFMWRLKAITSVENGIDEKALNSLREKRTMVIDELKQIIKQRPADDVKVQASTLLIDLYTLFTTIDEPTRDALLTSEDYQLPSDLQNAITDVLEEEIHVLHLSEKKSSNVERGDNDEDEDEDEDIPDADLSPEARSALHEKRICDLAARMTLAVLGGALPKSFAQTLQRHKGKIGQSYDKVILELGVLVEKPAPTKKVEPAKPMEDVIEVASEMDES